MVLSIEQDAQAAAEAAGHRTVATAQPGGPPPAPADLGAIAGPRRWARRSSDLKPPNSFIAGPGAEHPLSGQDRRRGWPRIAVEAIHAWLGRSRPGKTRQEAPRLGGAERRRDASAPKWRARAAPCFRFIEGRSA